MANVVHPNSINTIYIHTIYTYFSNAPVVNSNSNVIPTQVVGNFGQSLSINCCNNIVNEIRPHQKSILGVFQSNISGKDHFGW